MQKVFDGERDFMLNAIEELDKPKQKKKGFF